MKKMKTLFERQFSDHHVVKCLNKVQEGCEWVLDGEGYATEKIDGTCCWIKDGKLYKRFDYKPGRKLPSGAIPCQEAADPVTGHFPHWVPCDEKNPADKYHIKAFKMKEPEEWEDGTYELIGKHFQGNPYGIEDDGLEKHGERILEGVPRTYEGIKAYLESHNIEGVVFYRGDGTMCKIKRSDFGFKWPATDKKEKKVAAVGSLDFIEFVIDPKNKDSDPESIGTCIAEYMKILKDEDWSMFRLHVLDDLKHIREEAERRKNEN